MTMSCCDTYSVLREIGLFHRRHLPLFQTLADFFLAVEIGYHARCCGPLTLKQLFLLEIAPPATVQRRLKRLIHLGIVNKRFRPGDGRMVEFGLSPRGEKLLADYAQYIARVAGVARKTGQGHANMIKVVDMATTMQVCGTCAHWEGAREFRDGLCSFVADSEGSCRWLAEQGRSFVDSITLSTREGRPQCWKPCES